MNPLQHALIEKAGYDHGFEYVLPGTEDAVHLESARHNAQVRIVPTDRGFDLAFFSVGQAQLIAELARCFTLQCVHAQDSAPPSKTSLPGFCAAGLTWSAPCPTRPLWIFRTASKRNWLGLPPRRFRPPKSNDWCAWVPDSRPSAGPCSTTEETPARSQVSPCPKCCAQAMPNPGRSAKTMRSDWTYSTDFCSAPIWVHYLITA